MNNKVSGIVDYISHLMKKYNELQQIQMSNTFRVASVKNTGSGHKIIFQVIGKSTFMESTPAEILSNEAFIERFSKKDIQKITYIHAQNQNLKSAAEKSHELKLTQQEFNVIDGKTRFTIKDKEGNTSLKFAAEIVVDKKIINKLSQEEVLNVGYIAGYEHSQNDTNN